MKLFVVCQIQEYLGPTIASLKDHVIQFPLIARALNEDMNTFQEFLSQPRTRAATKGT